LSIIELCNISKSYGSKKILDNISININEGEFVAITGESGKGKSTILNIIGLLEIFDSGKLTIDNETNLVPNSIKSRKMLREKISYLFQNFALVDQETVLYNLLLVLKYVKQNKNYKLKIIKESLSKVGLDGYEKRKIYELSGGEQQRVAIARILLKPSKIVLADEPTGSLDENNRDAVINLLRLLNNDGKTIVIVTHDKSVAKSCDRIINL
jgi:putative ABC transport system ATP-binding protein